MAQRDTSVSDLCKELGIERVTLYRYVGPNGKLRLRSARACCQNAMMMTGAPIKLTQADAADVADLYNRCSDYFLLQDGAAPTLDDARELFSDVPPEKSAHNQAVLGWKGLAAYMQSRPSSAIIRVMAHGISAS
jgi:hypothetical protein